MKHVWVIYWHERGYPYRDAEAFTSKRRALRSLKNETDSGWTGRLYRVDLGGLPIVAEHAEPGIGGEGE